MLNLVNFSIINYTNNLTYLHIINVCQDRRRNVVFLMTPSDQLLLFFLSELFFYQYVLEDSAENPDFSDLFSEIYATIICPKKI